MRVLLSLLALSQCRLMALQYTAVTVRLTQDNENLQAASKSVDFVNKVRADLRRNNDDYALLEGRDLLQHPAPRAPARARPPPARRADGGEGPAPPRLADGQQTNQSAAGFRSFKHPKNKRVSKLMKRLNRAKDMMRQQPEENTEPTTTLTQPTTTTTSAPTPAPSPSPEPSPAGALMQAVQELSTPAPRRPLRNRPPLPNQVDMAHARDPVITRLRLKGRLCQRTLLNMEGPTYDRDGKEVMPEHHPHHARGRLFHQTRAPALVLPKCCNCCKKSVLGCQ